MKPVGSPVRKILVVDDEPDLRELIADILRADYHDIVECENGKVALERIKTEAFTLVVSDINMPGMSGIELMASTRELGLEMPFVFLTASENEEYVFKALRLGAFDFIKKPFANGTVKDVVARAVEVGFRQQKLSESSAAPEERKQAEKMVRMLELQNFKKRA